MNIEYLRNIEDINFDLLPSAIKNEFEKIKNEFYIKEGIYYSKFIFNNIYTETTLCLNIEELDKRIKFNQDIKDTITNPEFGYEGGCFEGYLDSHDFINLLKEEEYQILEIFQGIYNKLPTIQNNDLLQLKENIPRHYNIDTLQFKFHNYGIEVGRFINYWTIILNNTNRFEDIFKKYYEVEIITNPSVLIPLSAEPKLKHENTFSNNGFILFEYLLDNHIRLKGKTGRFSDIADYYWKMYNSKTQYIHQRPEAFKKWFYKEYDKEDIGKIKTANNLKDSDRDKHYSDSLDWFKSKNY